MNGFSPPEVIAFFFRLFSKLAPLPPYYGSPQTFFCTISNCLERNSVYIAVFFSYRHPWCRSLSHIRARNRTTLSECSCERALPNKTGKLSTTLLPFFLVVVQENWQLLDAPPSVFLLRAPFLIYEGEGPPGKAQLFSPYGLVSFHASFFSMRTLIGRASQVTYASISSFFRLPQRYPFGGRLFFAIMRAFPIHPSSPHNPFSLRRKSPRSRIKISRLRLHPL